MTVIGLMGPVVQHENRRDRFEDIFLPHLDAAYNLARWITRDPSDADDVVQEAYLRAFKFFDGFHGGDGRSWILKIVRNTCYTWLQKNRPREIVYELEEDQHVAQDSDPEAHLIESVDRQALRQLLSRLPHSAREIIVLRDIEGLSYKEISSVMDLPLGTVMSRLARARRKLQSEAAATQAGVLK
jgi:RNA polymerase sigma-70 factor (ECF subfamily)